MQILKENKVIWKYILPIITIPLIILVLNQVIIFLFQIGRYYGTFIRALYELACRSL